jgi:TorA maturation chaperone TorD
MPATYRGTPFAFLRDATGSSKMQWRMNLGAHAPNAMAGMNLEPHRPEAKRGRNMDWVVQFEGQMLVCGVLAKALYGAPDREWMDGLVAAGLFDSVPFGSDLPEIAAALDCLGRWSNSVEGGLGDEAFAALTDDYTRLFVGPGRLLAAPWESVYANKDRAVFQKETVSVRNWYLRFELGLTSEYNEPADHIGLEFAFLAELAQRTIEASDIRDGREVKRLIDAQRAFLGQHLLPWVPRWAGDVVEHARTDLYRGLAWLARGTVIEAASFFSVASEQPVRSGAFQRTAQTQH